MARGYYLAVALVLNTFMRDEKVTWEFANQCRNAHSHSLMINERNNRLPTMVHTATAYRMLDSGVGIASTSPSIV